MTQIFDQLEEGRCQLCTLGTFKHLAYSLCFGGGRRGGGGGIGCFIKIHHSVLSSQNLGQSWRCLGIQKLLLLLLYLSQGKPPSTPEPESVPNDKSGSCCCCTRSIAYANSTCQCFHLFLLQIVHSCHCMLNRVQALLHLLLVHLSSSVSSPSGTSRCQWSSNCKHHIMFLKDFLYWEESFLYCLLCMHNFGSHLLHSSLSWFSSPSVPLLPFFLLNFLHFHSRGRRQSTTLKLQISDLPWNCWWTHKLLHPKTACLKLLMNLLQVACFPKTASLDCLLMNPQTASPYKCLLELLADEPTSCFTQIPLLELNDQQQASQTWLLELLLMNQGASFPSNFFGGQLMRIRSKLGKPKIFYNLLLDYYQKKGFSVWF